jgi:plastocyanin
MVRVLAFTCVLLAWAASAAGPVTGSIVLVGRDGHALKTPDYSGVVVSLEPIGTAPPPVAAPDAVVRQKNTMFTPHVIAVQVGTAVDFPNADPIFHNVFSNYDGQVFDVRLYAPETSRRVVFRRPGMARVFCNIHESMSAVVAVLPTPYFAVTRADGRFSIAAPPGQYRLRLWHERGEPDALARLERSLAVTDAGATVPQTTLAVGPDVVVPHLNKYGQKYAERAPDHIFYPGARR